ncbi:hypothetical protein [Shewanella nanhaiensis]|uniref:ABC transporter permease n=1 Tax=Shewanella nanhaiensis TaxID=2864872 RepID=A0ABS7E729_9GAMM|nr:hypothetical protein [Shewanella nanhaiensis]MBW8184966.1 hypothetical protein [Shewanella nanhaiensis]
MSSSSVIKLTINRFDGAVRLWLFDVVCASFFGVALLGLLLLLPIFWFEKFDVIPLMLSMFQVSVSISVAWQLNRLAATEWSVLIPRYRGNLQFQAATLLLFSFLICALISLVSGVDGSFMQLQLATAAGLIFIYLCLIKVQTYYWSVLLYLFLMSLSSLASQIPTEINLPLLVANGVLAWLLWQKANGNPWHPDARSVYLNAQEMGGVWLPGLKSTPQLAKFELWLHPVNFFMGPLLTILLLAMPIVTLVVAGLSSAIGGDIPALFLYTQFACVACSMVHWSRIHRWRAVESLYMLPGFDGKQGMRDAFNLGQVKLLILLTSMMGLVAAVISLFDPLINIGVWFHLVLSTLFGCGLILGVGSGCKNALQLSLLMLIIICQSVWISTSLGQISDGGEIWLWLSIDIILMVFSFVTLWWGSKKLWEGDFF